MSNSLKGRAIPVEIQVCVALRYLASNDFQIGIADDFHMSQPEVSLIVTKFLDAIATKVNEFVKFPTSVNEIREAQLEFYKIAGFPRVVGCLDCTHVRIQAPHDDENDYVNRKRYHSINVQAVCDADGKFIHFPQNGRVLHMIHSYYETVCCGMHLSLEEEMELF